MNEMVSVVAPMVTLVGAIMSLGYFLDVHIQEPRKQYVAARLRGANSRPLAKSAIDICVSVYETIFAPSIRSKRFLYRSAAAYVLLCIINIIYSLIFFPATFFNVWSGLLPGDTFLVGATWLLLVLGGGALFVAANAQTLYFLRLAQADSRLSHIGLILYADVLLTVSICVFGVAALVTTHTVTFISPSEHVEIVARVRPADQFYADQIERASADSSETLARTIENVSGKSSTLANLLVVETANRPSHTTLQRFKSDLDLAERYLERSNGPAVVRLADGGLQILDRHGRVYSFVTQESELHTGAAEWFAETLSPEQVCSQLLKPDPTETDRYVNLIEYRYSRVITLQHCVSGKPFVISAEVEINQGNVDFAVVFSKNVGAALETVAQWAFSGVFPAGNNHPLRGFTLGGDTGFWVHTHVIEERSRGATTAIDGALLDALLIEKGVGNLISLSGFPSVLVVFAVMSTSALTFFVVLGALAGSAASAALRLLNVAHGWVKFDEKPFSLLAAFTSLVVVVSMLLI